MDLALTRRCGFNVQWHIISDPSNWDFFYLCKICNFQDAQKRRPQAEFAIWQHGSSSFHGRIRFWAFQLAILAGKTIFSTFLVAPPIIIFKISKISETIIGGATGKVLKMAFPANMASWKAQNLILPWKLDDPSCQIPNSARGRHFWASWSLHIFAIFTQAKKITDSWVWNYVPCHVKGEKLGKIWIFHNIWKSSIVSQTQI